MNKTIQEVFNFKNTQDNFPPFICQWIKNATSRLKQENKLNLEESNVQQSFFYKFLTQVILFLFFSTIESVFFSLLLEHIGYLQNNKLLISSYILVEVYFHLLYFNFVCKELRPVPTVVSVSYRRASIFVTNGTDLRRLMVCSVKRR